MKLTQEKIIVIAGVLLMLIPFTGFPRDWKSIITAAIGLIIVYVGALLWRKNKILEKRPETRTGTFTETA
jgi:hypothetical protein